MNVILRTGGKTVESIIKLSQEDPQQMNLTEEDAKIVKAYLDEFDGAEVVLTDEGPHHFIIGWAGDRQTTQKVKNAIYLMHQDPMFGRYINDREAFEHDWDEEEVGAESISFRENEFEVLDETPMQRFKRLKRKHPGIKIINEVIGDAKGVNNTVLAGCYIREYILQNGTYLFRDAAKLYVDDMTSYASKEEYEQARKGAWDIVKGLMWQQGLFLQFKVEE